MTDNHCVLDEFNGTSFTEEIVLVNLFSGQTGFGENKIPGNHKDSLVMDRNSNKPK